MTIREFWRDVRDRLFEDRRHPGDRWPRRGDESMFAHSDEWRDSRWDETEDWRREHDDYRAQRWPRDEGYDEYERGMGAGTQIGGAEITSGFFELTRPDAGGFAGPEREYERGSFRGRGPKGYRRSDEYIREDVCECLTEDEDLDASEIEVSVVNGEVTLTGMVASRLDKRYAEDLSASVTGVRDVHNMLRTELQ
jgi:BON domain